MNTRQASLTIASAIAASGLWGSLALAAPAVTSIRFTPPLAAAKTIQVTEIVWEAQYGPAPELLHFAPEPLHLAAAITFRLKRPNKFQVVVLEPLIVEPRSFYVFDGKTMAAYDANRHRRQPFARIEWSTLMSQILNNFPGTVSCVPAVRQGKKILLAVSISPSSRSEFWLDPKTHLLTHREMFVTFQGKMYEIMRADYVDWALNKPLSPAVFQASSVELKHP